MTSQYSWLARIDSNDHNEFQRLVSCRLDDKPIGRYFLRLGQQCDFLTAGALADPWSRRNFSKFGGSEENRTLIRRFKRPLLYPLSYEPNWRKTGESNSVTPSLTCLCFQDSYRPFSAVFHWRIREDLNPYNLSVSCLANTCVYHFTTDPLAGEEELESSLHRFGDGPNSRYLTLLLLEHGARVELANVVLQTTV